jgi:hypothetical protein
MKISLFLARRLLFSTGFLFFTFLPPALALEKMLVLKGAGELFDVFSMRLSEQGIRIRTKIGEGLWLAAKPQSYIMINPENKTFLEVSFKWYVEDLREDYPKIKWDRKVEKLVGEKFGQKVTRTAFIRKDSLSKDSLAKNSGPKGVNTELNAAELDSIKVQGLPPAVLKVLTDLLSVESRGETLPIYCKQLMRRHWFGEMITGPERRLKTRTNNGRENTTKVMFEVKEFGWQPYDASFFRLSKDLKRARDRASLFLSTDGDIKEKDIEDFFMRELK